MPSLVKSILGCQKVNAFMKEHPVGLTRLEQGENLEENQKNLRQITERFFQAIVGSSSEFPPQLRSVCHCLYQVRCSPTSLSLPLQSPSRLCLNHQAAYSAFLLSCVCHISSSCLLHSLRHPNAFQIAAFYSANINPLLYWTCQHSFFLVCFLQKHRYLYVHFDSFSIIYPSKHRPLTFVNNLSIRMPIWWLIHS